MIPANVLAIVEQRLASLRAPVTIDYFHQSDSRLIVPGAPPRPSACPACAPTKETLEDIARVSTNVELVVHEFHGDPALVERLGVERVPAIVLQRSGSFPPLRFFGLPGGHFLQVLVETLIGVASVQPPPPPALAAIIDRLREPALLRVLGSLRDEASAQAAVAAYQLALLSEKFKAVVMELDTYPEVAQQLQLRELPVTLVGDGHGLPGISTPMALAQLAVDVQDDKAAGTAPASPAPPAGDAPPPAAASPSEAPSPGAAAPPAPQPQPAIETVDPAAEGVDVAIVGGGPAGLQAALVLARARKTVRVFDDPAPARNAASHGVHSFLGLDGMLPAELGRVAWEQIAAYGHASLEKAQVVDIRRGRDGDFVLTCSNGSKLGAHHVVLAFGHREMLPDLPGFADCYGDTIISCPFCDGYEHQDRVWGIVVPEVGASAVSPLLAQNWTNEIRIILGGAVALPEEFAAELEGQGIGVHVGSIVEVHHEDGKIVSVTLDGGDEVAVETLVWVPEAEPAPLLRRLGESLGLAVGEGGFIATNPLQQTNVERLWAAGDAIASTMAIDAARSGGAIATLIVQGWFEEPGASTSGPQDRRAGRG